MGQRTKRFISTGAMIAVLSVAGVAEAAPQLTNGRYEPFRRVPPLSNGRYEPFRTVTDVPPVGVGIHVRQLRA